MNKIFDLKALFALISIVLAIIFFVISRNVKELSFKNVAITELVSGKNIKDESIKVFFDKEQIFNLYSISCILSNSGNLPISGADYLNGFEIQFPDSVKILKYSLKMFPDNILNKEIKKNGSTISIFPDLLNPNDRIELSFYVSSPLTNLLPHSTSRLIGGNILNLNMNEEIKSKTEFNNRAFASFEGPIFWIAFVYTILYILLMFWASYFQKNGTVGTPLGKLFLFLFLCIGLICNLFYLIQTKF
jgi:hypothetical protein